MVDLGAMVILGGVKSIVPVGLADLGWDGIEGDLEGID